MLSFNGFGLDITSVLFYVALLNTLSVIGIALYYYINNKWIEKLGMLNLPLYQGIAFLATLPFFPLNNLLLIFALGLLLVSCITYRALNHYYHPVGSFTTCIKFITPFVGYIWGIWYLYALDLHWISYACIGVMLLISFILLPTHLISFIELNEILFRRKIKRPYQPLTPHQAYCPKVCIHVPTYSEPPEMVIETLNCIAKLDYSNFDVILIDNNTKDESLWLPVKKHCEMLGDNFKFIHVDNMQGAKAGALNYALSQTHPDCELIAIVDADYQVKTDFLAKLTGYFADPETGFVQTPHDYRDWQHSLYLKMCYWEYRPFHWSAMTTLNEHNAGITVGTMCIIRRTALEEAGGWAIWCVTEDSELAIRIHALGYHSHFIQESFGQGLIPENFTDYRKQRFRWTAGPIQEFKRHFNMLLPLPWCTPSNMNWRARLHHFNHGPQQTYGNEMIFFLPVIAVFILSMLATQPSLYLPGIFWFMIPLALISQLAYQLMLSNIVLGCSIKEILLSHIAGTSLRYIRMIGVLKAAFGRHIPWLRTNKFKTNSNAMNVLLGIKGELVISFISLTIMLFSIALMPWHGLWILFILGSVYGFVTSLSAPFMAVLAAKTLGENR